MPIISPRFIKKLHTRCGKSAAGSVQFFITRISLMFKNTNENNVDPYIYSKLDNHDNTYIFGIYGIIGISWVDLR